MDDDESNRGAEELGNHPETGLTPPLSVEPVGARPGEAQRLAPYGSWPVVLGVIAALIVVTGVLMLPVSFVLAALDPALGDEDLLSSPLLLFLGIVLQGLAGLAIVYVLLINRGVTSWREMRLTGSRAPNFLLQGLGYAVLFLLAGVVIEVVQSSLGIRLTQPEFESIRVASLAGKVAIWVVGVLVAPVAEEILFRGFLFRAITARKGVVRGVLYSSLLFGVLHVDPTSGLRNAGIFLPVVAGAVILALAYRRSGDLWVPITAHALNNAFAFTILLLSA